MQCWDEQHRVHYYHNARTLESTWSPPPAFADLSPPAAAHAPPATAAAGSLAYQLCAGCRFEFATRWCSDCAGTPYCEQCWRSTHSVQPALTHAWQPLAYAVATAEVAAAQRQVPVIHCVECEAAAASLRCITCTDAFCEPCFRLVHRKGTKASHAWQPLAGGPVQRGEAGMTATASLDLSAGAMLAAAAGWVQYVDDTTGRNYWYHPDSGETRWG